MKKKPPARGGHGNVPGVAAPRSQQSKGEQGKAARVERRTTRRAGRVVDRATKKLNRINRRRSKFGLDPVTGRPTEGAGEPQATTDPYSGAPTINVFNAAPGGDAGSQYPTGSFQPTERPVTDRTKLDLANQVGNL
jgi:hypothetical protein